MSDDVRSVVTASFLCDFNSNMITIVDYGMGNLRSVQKAFEKLDIGAEIVTAPDQIASAEKLVLPGVGAFRDAIHELERLELVEPIREHIRRDKPFLGICLGLQMLFDVSFEDGEWKGLGVLKGDVVRFPAMPDLKVPHMGWNTLEVTRPSPLLTERRPDRRIGLLSPQLLRASPG